MSRLLSLRHKQHGFTLVELMIATLVFSVVLLMVTFGILQITRVYFKGVNETNTQNVARSITDTITQSIQFSGGAVLPTLGTPATPSSPLAFCVGDTRFTYALGYQLSDSPDSSKHQSYHALAVDNHAGCSQHTTQPLNAVSISGRELLSPNMRLANLRVDDLSNNLYRVTVRVIFGDDDLLYSPSNPSNPNGDTATDAKCKSTTGSQFCAVSEFSTVVVKRVE